MGRPKGSKNKSKLETIDEAIDKMEEYDEDCCSGCPTMPEIECNFKRIEGNPLVGYTLDEIQGFIDEINPNCARGGCLHKKMDHQKNAVGKLECHKCSCPNFLE